MHAVIGRLLLLLLLACDWAADPHQGTSPLSRPLASTECICHSLAHREAVRQGCLPALQGGPGGPPAHVSTPWPRPAPRVQEPPDTAPAAGFVYVFMSLRR
jgi:hypothetical protein